MDEHPTGRTRVSAPPGPDPYSGLDPVAASHRIFADRRRQRRWIGALWTLAVLVVALAAVTAAVTVGRLHHSGRSSAATGPTSSSTSGSTTTPLATGNGLQITSISPPQGSVGQTVVITGTNLVSPDGQVLAHFGDQVAPTSCSSATTCTAVVPSPSAGAPRVQVTITTQTGSSNGLWFTYS